MPHNVILVHGYSVRSFDAYGLLPQLLQNEGYDPKLIYLSAFDSLNDDITCDDLALALEARVGGIAGLDLGDTAVIAHSTGAIIVRRWILNRRNAGLPLPSHFISMAGANHGSTLAQLGETQLAYLFRAADGGTSVGLEVLQDLDYGSPFLLKLNEEWLDAGSAKEALPVRVFSMIGDDHSALENQIFWQSHESGSDCTVRISGGNLNYRFIAIDQTMKNPAFTIKQLGYTVPHLILHGICHTGDNGILGGNQQAMDVVFPCIKAALNTTTWEDYAAIGADWTRRSQAWSDAYSSECNATIVFSLKHPGGRNVAGSLILIKDQSKDTGSDSTNAILSVANSILSRQPIENNTTPSSVSFYVNYPEFIKTYPHTVEIQVNSGSNEITYAPARYTVTADGPTTIRPNEFIYVSVTLNRQAIGTYSVIPQSQNPPIHVTWPPMPGSLD